MCIKRGLWSDWQSNYVTRGDLRGSKRDRIRPEETEGGLEDEGSKRQAWDTITGLFFAITFLSLLLIDSFDTWLIHLTSSFFYFWYDWTKDDGGGKSPTRIPFSLSSIMPLTSISSDFSFLDLSLRHSFSFLVSVSFSLLSLLLTSGTAMTCGEKVSNFFWQLQT